MTKMNIQTSDERKLIQWKYLCPRLFKEMEKYTDLVWFARSNSQEPNIVQIRDRIRAKYSEEIEKLEGDDGDWEHGFNSGMLACCRLFGDYLLDDDAYNSIIEYNEDCADKSYEEILINNIQTAHFPQLGT